MPATPFDLEQLERFRPGKPGRVSFAFARSSARNRFYRAFCSVVAEGLGVAPGLLHAELKFKCGLIKNIMLTKTAGTVIELKSTAFAELDETEFSEFVTMAIEVVFAEYLPGVQRKDILARVEELVGEPLPV